VRRTAQAAWIVLASVALFALAPSAMADALEPEHAQMIIEQALKELAPLGPDLAEQIRVAGAAGATSGEAAFALAPAKSLPGPGGGGVGTEGGIIAACACLGDLPGLEGRPKLSAGAYLVVIRKAGQGNWAAYYITPSGNVAASAPSTLTELEAPVSVPAAKVNWDGDRLAWSLQLPAAGGKPSLVIACDLSAPAAGAAPPPPKEEEKPAPKESPKKGKPGKKPKPQKKQPKSPE
jgi:hypothetical protein